MVTQEISAIQNSLPSYSAFISDDIQQMFSVPETVAYNVDGLNSTSCATKTTLGLATNTTLGLATNTTNTTLGQSQHLPFGRGTDYNNPSSSNVRDNMMKQLILNQMTLENQMGTLSKDLIYNINALYAKVTKLEKNIETLKNLKTT